jgi:hypothetical protein
MSAQKTRARFHYQVLRHARRFAFGGVSDSQRSLVFLLQSQGIVILFVLDLCHRHSFGLFVGDIRGSCAAPLRQSHMSGRIPATQGAKPSAKRTYAPTTKELNEAIEDYLHQASPGRHLRTWELPCLCVTFLTRHPVISVSTATEG